jgi:hypothetical protein
VRGLLENIIQLPEFQDWIGRRVGLFSSVSAPQIEFMLLESLPKEKSSMFCEFFHEFFPVEDSIKEIIEHLDSRNFIDILRRKTKIIKKFKLFYMLKDCDFFDLKSKDKEEKEDKKKDKKKEKSEKNFDTQLAQKEIKENKSKESKESEKKEENNEAEIPSNIDSSQSSILNFLFKKVNLINSNDEVKKSDFLINKLLKNPKTKKPKHQHFHYSIKNLNRFFHPRKKQSKTKFRKISYQIQKNLRYNSFPNIYSGIINSMRLNFESIPPQIERIEEPSSKTSFLGLSPESERLPADEETILAFDDIIGIAELLEDSHENPFYEILPLGIEPVLKL